MKAQAVAERQRPVLAVTCGDDALHHLRLRLIGRVLTEQRVEHHHPVVAGNVGGGPNRIEHGQIGLRDESKHLAFGGARNIRREQRDRRGGTTGK